MGQSGKGGFAGLIGGILAFFGSMLSGCLTVPLLIVALIIGGIGWCAIQFDKGINPTGKLTKDPVQDIDATKVERPEMVAVEGGEFRFGNVNIVYLDSFFITPYELTNKQVLSILKWAIKNDKVRLRFGKLTDNDSGYSIFGYVDKEYLTDTRDWRDLHPDFYVKERELKIYPGKENKSALLTWHGGMIIGNLFSAMEGLDPASDTKTLLIEKESTGYRLPTEAEWEYAARRGFLEDATSLHTYYHPFNHGTNHLGNRVEFPLLEWVYDGWSKFGVEKAEYKNPAGYPVFTLEEDRLSIERGNRVLRGTSVIAVGDKGRHNKREYILGNHHIAEVNNIRLVRKIKQE